ncbi:MAG: RHS repeat protein, partial [Anaerolineae bacterium]|nr:RHS repeat protein [Anaerolineae bacterium]
SRTEYDAIGQIVREIDANGNANRFVYDPLGRLVKVIDALGYATTYSYDPVGNMLTEADANGHVTTYTYDPLNRLVTETNPLNAIWTYTYDPEGNLIQTVDANGQTIRYAFDAVDQMIAIHYPVASQDVTFEYDPNGNLIRMEDAAGETTLRYDPLDREVGKVDPYGRALQNTYDPVGNRLSIVYPYTGTVTYTYNANDWLVEMADPRDGATTYVYDPDYLLIRTDYPNGTWTDQEYDKAGRLIRQFNGTAYNADVITSYEYTLDAVGNRLRTIEAYTSGQVRKITTTYTYNVRYEVLQTIENYEGPPSYTVNTSYTYDPVGNRLTMTTDRDTGPKPKPYTTAYIYDAANRMLAAGNVLYTYDANGNRLTKLTPGKPPAQTKLETYTYDAENRMTVYTRIRVQSGHIEQRVYNKYDGLGRRLDKGTQESTGVTKWVKYLLDGLSYDQLAEYPQIGQPIVTQLYRGWNGQLVSMDEIQGGGIGSQYWFATDGLSSMAATTKQNGQSAHEYFYDPYGQLIDENGHWEDSSSWTNPHNHYLLTGKEWDEESRLYYFGARFYDAEAGVWLTQDPYRGGVNSPMTRHRYLYVRNNPINRIDPLGFFDWNTGHVEWGDTLAWIAKDAGVSTQDIVSWNPQIKHPDVIYLGMYLWLPQDAVNAGKLAEAIRMGSGADEARWSKPGSTDTSIGCGPTSNTNVDCPNHYHFGSVNFQWEFGVIPQFTALGIGGFVELSAKMEDNTVIGSLAGGLEWEPLEVNPALKAANKIADMIGLEIELGAQIGLAGKIEYNICEKSGDVKICGFGKIYAGLYIKGPVGRDIISGKFEHQWAGAQASGEAEICLSLCSGRVTWSAGADWSIYFDVGWTYFSRRYEFGGEIATAGKDEYITTIEGLAIFKEFCGN